MAFATPKFYLAGSKRARKSGFLRSIDRKKPQFEQALTLNRNCNCQQYRACCKTRLVLRRLLQFFGLRPTNCLF
ncbi:MAG: hypothetical protein LBD18_07210 [Treponema sp.]|nr:hypothetical protein [Treponema sp.]